jgi:hypothetical protein
VMHGDIFTYIHTQGRTVSKGSIDKVLGLLHSLQQSLYTCDCLHLFPLNPISLCVPVILLWCLIRLLPHLHRFWSSRTHVTYIHYDVTQLYALVLMYVCTLSCVQPMRLADLVSFPCTHANYPRTIMTLVGICGSSTPAPTMRDCTGYSQCGYPEVCLACCI